MRQKKLRTKLYGLKIRFALAIAVAGLISAAVFCILYFVSDHVLTSYFEDSILEEMHINGQVESLQEYIIENEIDAEHLSKLTKWEKKQPLILLEIYDGDACIYSSYYSDYRSRGIGKGFFYGRDNVFDIDLNGKKVRAILYSDFFYQYYLFGTMLSILAALILFIILFTRDTGKLIAYICKLEADVQILEGGNLEYPITEHGNDELTDLAKSLNRMRVSFVEQLKTEQALYQSRDRLVTEMSHDLRTPLTGILLYTEILRSHRYESEEELQTCLDKIDIKAHNLKMLSDHLFEYTLDGRPPEIGEILTAEQAFSEMLHTLESDLKARGFEVEKVLEWDSCYVLAKREYLQRIFDNISSNLQKYAEKTVPVMIETFFSAKNAGLIFTNTIAEDPNKEDSTGIGIESIRSMMEEMGGSCSVEQTESVFEMTLYFGKK